MVIVALLAICVALTALTHDPWPVDDGFILITLGVYCAVGYVMARARPRNPIGWIFLVLGLLGILNTAVSLYLVLDHRQHGGRLPLGGAAVFWRGSFSILPFILGLPAILLFPDGRLSDRWRWLLRVYVGAGVLFVLMQYTGHAIDPGLGLGRVDIRGNLPNNSGGSLGSFAWLLVPLFLAYWFAFVAHQVNAWRSSTGVQRAQLKWLAAGGAVSLVSSILLVVAGDGVSTIARLWKS